MHARKAVIEAIQMRAAQPSGLMRQRLSYPVLEEVRHDHYEVTAMRISTVGGTQVGLATLGVGITPVLAWLAAKRNMGLSRG